MQSDASANYRQLKRQLHRDKLKAVKEVQQVAPSREATKIPKNQLTEYSTSGQMGVIVAEDFAPVPLKPKSALKNRAATEFFENQIKGTVGQKDLYEYSEKIEGDEAINVRAFRKYAYGGVGTFHKL